MKVYISLFFWLLIHLYMYLHHTRTNKKACNPTISLYRKKDLCQGFNLSVCLFFFIGHNKTSIIFMTNKHTDLSLSLSLSFTLVPIHPFPFLLKQISCERWQSLCTAFELKSFKIHVYFNILYISLISTIRKLVQMRNNTLFSAKK